MTKIIVRSEGKRTKENKEKRRRNKKQIGMNHTRDGISHPVGRLGSGTGNGEGGRRRRNRFTQIITGTILVTANNLQGRLGGRTESEWKETA